MELLQTLPYVGGILVTIASFYFKFKADRVKKERDILKHNQKVREENDRKESLMENQREEVRREANEVQAKQTNHITSGTRPDTFGDERLRNRKR